MIAHVAEAGEGRGRVVLQLGPSAEASPIVLAAALHVARCFQSEIEALFVEDRQLFDMASFPFAREISHSGRVLRPLSTDDIAAELQHVAAVLERKVRTMAATAGIGFRSSVLRDEPVSATARACAESGPWNVVALAGPLKGHEASLLQRLFEEVHEFTGLVVAGAGQARKPSRAPGAVQGSIVALVEDLDHLQPMLRTAERLSMAEERDIRVVLAADDPFALEWLEDQCRLVIGEDGSARLVPAVLPAEDAAAAVREVSRLGPGFVIARWGGRIAPLDGDLSPLASLLDAPVLLVR